MLLRTEGDGLSLLDMIVFILLELAAAVVDLARVIGSVMWLTVLVVLSGQWL
jgi:hypothetical protein